MLQTSKRKISVLAGGTAGEMEQRPSPQSPQLEDKEERGKARDGKAANLGLGPVEGASPPAPQR